MFLSTHVHSNLHIRGKYLGGGEVRGEGSLGRLDRASEYSWNVVKMKHKPC